MDYREYGKENAPIIVFLHGGGVSGWMWDNQVAYFSDYHCIVPNISIGSSENTFSIRGYAEKLIGFLQEKGKGRSITIVGFSLGAQISLEILSIDSALIDKAIINSALVKPMPVTRLLIGPTIKLTSWLSKQKGFARLQAKELYIGKEYFDTYYEETKNMKTKSIIDMLHENLSYSLPSKFCHSKGKILATVGEKEKQIMKESLNRILESNPCTKGVIIPHIGHGFPFAFPQLFNQTVEAWILDRPLPGELKIINE
ncbi:alpha/beta hydrolase [Mesobacillus foraminis]|uniref:alpha/beta fold hydrolase n=1 Tax=Mesobacillus foraminis TaxID=279826 RepID=UPI001BE60EE8|nr:alpha/beta hydrolase [Mesobacillus foraminis]MBT2757679.1 alpha/beta hydrolase [Mesobacillus foraminis]